MLRRKLLLHLGAQVLLLLLTTVLAIVLLQDVLRQLDRIGSEPANSGAAEAEMVAANQPSGEFDSSDVLAHVDPGAAELRTLSARLRWIVLGLALVFLVVINMSVIALLRMGGTILRPLDQLVEASRELARERLDYRVHVEQDDEFGELAHSFNSLAEQLQANEQRKMEMLQQVARAINHELNNVMAIIELQMQMLARKSHGSPATDKYLSEIRASLERMTKAVQSLKNIRRIVLTDYVPGTKMLDLQRSTEDRDDAAVAVVAPAASAAASSEHHEAPAGQV